VQVSRRTQSGQSPGNVLIEWKKESSQYLLMKMPWRGRHPVHSRARYVRSRSRNHMSFVSKLGKIPVKPPRPRRPRCGIGRKGICQ